MSRAVVLLSTEEFERAHGRAPTGIGDWSFAFDAYYVDGASLEAALRSNNTSRFAMGRASAALAGDCVITIHDCAYEEARKLAVEIAKGAVRASVDGLRMEVMR